MAIIVALVEEGGADVNSRGGMAGDTPLMRSVRWRGASVSMCVTALLLRHAAARGRLRTTCWHTVPT